MKSINSLVNSFRGVVRCVVGGGYEEWRVVEMGMVGGAHPTPLLFPAAGVKQTAIDWRLVRDRQLEFERHHEDRKSVARSDRRAAMIQFADR